MDSGPGVRPELRDRIFERFTQGDEQVEGRFGGTGLGLSITHDFIALHGGRIEVRDAPEGGAAFVVEIPLAAPAGKAAPDGVTTLHGIAVPHAITASDVSLRIPVPSAAAEMIIRYRKTPSPARQPHPWCSWSRIMPICGSS